VVEAKGAVGWRGRVVSVGLSSWETGGALPPVSFSAADHHAQTAGFVCELK
jgi:hypothetical protein